MFTTASQFFQADANVFLDLTALTLVRFESTGQDATVHLKFKDGGSETIHGEAAINLHLHLTGVRDSGTDAPSESVQQLGIGGEVESGEPPSKTIHLKNVVISSDTMFLGRNKAWFFGKDKNGRGLILAFVNAKGSCSVRPFDGETSMALGKRYASGHYQEHFADLIEGATELTVDSQPNLERDCKQRLPERLFAHLREQIGRIPS
jgi:hypothetical protein